MVGIIIFGTRGVTRKVDTGSFYCPSCQYDAPYTRHKVTRFFTLYFIPVIPLGSLGEYVSCDRCASQYATEILTMGYQGSRAAAVPWVCAGCGNTNPPEYASCVSCNSARSYDQMRSE